MEAILLGSYMVLWVKAARIQAMGWLLRYNFCASRGDSETFEPWGGHEDNPLGTLMMTGGSGSITPKPGSRKRENSSFYCGQISTGI